MQVGGDGRLPPWKTLEKQPPLKPPNSALDSVETYLRVFPTFVELRGAAGNQLRTIEGHPMAENAQVTAWRQTVNRS